jgi:hypothetical protein
VTERPRAHEIDDDDGRWLVRIIGGGSGSVVIRRQARMVPLSAQGMAVPAIAKVAGLWRTTSRSLTRRRIRPG